MTLLQAVLFDKDGTLIDFHRTWGPATGAGLRAAAGGDEATLQAAAAAIGYDLASGTFESDSVFIAESNDVIMELLAPHVDVPVFGAACMAAAEESTAPADGLPELLHALRGRGIATAVVTNDWVEIADAQLVTLGWMELFDAVVGSDSGYGAKPQPGMVLGALAELGGIDPSAALMVGDTAHDLHAARAAGVGTTLVTNGSEPAADLIALADITVASLDELWDVLAAEGLVG